MAKLKYIMNVSLDGYVEDAQGNFDFATPSVPVNDYINELAAPMGTYLYGRRMYEAMAYWESDYKAHDLPQFSLDWAAKWQSVDKIVYSTTLTEPRTTRTRIERVFDPEAIRQLKATAEQDLWINGPGLAAHALKTGLVDELQMLVCPAVIGGGKPYFPDGVRLTVEQLEERKFPNGVVALRYAVLP